MSILIKGMEMPTSCGQCYFCHDFAPFKEEEYACRLKQAFVADKTVRDPDCPLVDVPAPHGRLIDVDPLIEEYGESAKGFYMDTVEALSGIVEEIWRADGHDADHQ